jgi:serine/threonine protein kinase
MNKAGDTLTNRQLDEYRVLALLGQGGMARVYLAEDIRLGRNVAIKVIDRPFREEPAYIERFEREAQAIARLEHPHIVRLYRYGETKRLFYMAMQFVEGADLGAILESYRREGRLIPPRDALAIVRDVGAALDYAHHKGVIHRDLKPSNILLSLDGRAYLTDFGLALLATTPTLGQTFGTPQYISPEQASTSGEVLPQSDLYSLGVILYEMFTGTLPFGGRGPLQIALQHRDEPPPDPRHRRPDLDPAVAAVILTALAKSPAARYQNGAALTHALESALSGRPVTTVVGPSRSLAERVTGIYDVRLETRTAAAGLPDETLPTAPFRFEDLEDREPGGMPVPVPAPSGRVQPVLRGRNTRPALLGAILLLTICLATALAFLATRGDDSLAALLRPAASPPPPTPTVAPPVVSPPTGTPPAPEPTPAVPPNPNEQTGVIQVVTRGDEALFLVNYTSEPVRLAGFQIGDGEGAIRGVEWELVSLAPGECVTVWKEQGNPEAPDVDCEPAGARVTRHSRDVFWNNPFSVYYRESLLGACQNSCAMTLPEP